MELPPRQSLEFRCKPDTQMLEITWVVEGKRSTDPPHRVEKVVISQRMLHMCDDPDALLGFQIELLLARKEGMARLDT